jgi:hypothetical protein
MNWLTSRIAPVAALAGLLALAGCEKDTDQVVDLPDTTPISTKYDVYGVTPATVRFSPVASLKADNFLVGRLRDDLVGTVEANSYFNVVAAGLSDSLPFKSPRIKLDSVVLVMGFNKVYGSDAVPARFDVFSLVEPLSDLSVYNSNSEEVLGPALGTNLTSRLDRTRQVTVPGVGTTLPTTTTQPDQTVRLLLQRTAAPAVASSFGTGLFTELKNGTTLTQARLNAVLKGIALKPAAGYDQAIVSFPRTSAARIQVYFHNDTATVPSKWQSYSVGFASVSAGASVVSDPRYYTQLKTNLAGGTPAPLAALATGQAAIVPAIAGKTYLQGGVGLGTRITLEQLAPLRASRGLAINRAELRIPVKAYSNALFPLPTSLYALEVDDANRVLQRTVNFTAVDRVVQGEGANPRGTGLESLATLVNANSSEPYYSLPVTNYLQAYLNNNLDGVLPTGLVLMPTELSTSSGIAVRNRSGLNLSRAVLDANNIKFYVYYSKL